MRAWVCLGAAPIMTRVYDGRGLILLLVRGDLGPPSLALICYRKACKAAWLADHRPRIARHRPRSGSLERAARTRANEGSAGGLAKSALAVAPECSTQLGGACGFLRCFGRVSLIHELRR